MACLPICGFLILELDLSLSDKMGKKCTLVHGKQVITVGAMVLQLLHML